MLELLSEAVPAAAQRWGSLTVVPLTAAGAPDLPYALLPDALAAGSLRITERGSGVVGELVAKNLGDEDVLVLDGDLLVGAKQNRTASRSIVCPARSTVVIPVSCVEAGRWYGRTAGFRAAAHKAPLAVRRHPRTVEAAYARRRAAPGPEVLAAAQAHVWREIDGLAWATRARTPTRALDAIFDENAPALQAATASFPLVDEQVGLVAFLEGAALGLEILGGRNLYARVHDRLVRSLVLEARAWGADPAALRRRAFRGAWALGHNPNRPGAGPGPRFGYGPRPGTPGPDDAMEFLARVRAAPRTEAPTVGRGRYRVLGDGVLGGELVDRERVLHLCAFPA